MDKEKVTDLNKDITEVNKLLNQSERSRIKNVLTAELRQLEIELKTALKDSQEMDMPIACASSSSPQQKRYQIKLTQFGWDQSDKHIKIFVSIKDVHTLPKALVYCNLKERSLELHVKNLDNKDYILIINKLLNTIVIEECYWKQKRDMVIIWLAKSQQSIWTHLTETERRCAQQRSSASTSARDEDQHHDESLVDLVRTMYDTGNNDMRRIITKAWYEGQQKKT